MRKIPKSLAIVGLLTPLVAPVNAGALGIGDIRVRSSLNQSLVAEIPLVTSGSDSISDIRINLAPPEAFARAGIDRQFFLSKLAFKPVQKGDGTYIIQVTSRDPITEPFLNFLVEVNWPQGHLLREFTALLDPPATYEDKSPVSAQLPEATKTVEEPQPAALQNDTASKPIRPKRTAPPRAQMPVQSADSGSYGPVRKDETLWNIARSIGRETKARPEQVMQAIYDANPNAFARGNINLLKAGATLIVPGASGNLQAAHTAPVETARTPTTTEAKTPPSAPSEENLAGQLKLFSPTDQPSPSAPTSASTDVGNPPTSAAPEKAKAVERASKENDEFKSRLADLEQKLSAMQGLITLKDQQIATLQSTKKPSDETKNAAEATPQTPPGVIAQPPVVTPGTSPEAAGTPKAPPSTTSSQTVVKTEPLAKASPPSVSSKPSVPAPAAEKDSWLPEPYYLLVGGVGTLLLGALLWVTYKRRAAMLDDFESMFPRDAQESAFSEVYANQRPSEEKSAAGSDAGGGSKSSFLVEFSASDFDALDTESDELDPISEADVYLAYGRYKQAEDLIRHAINQHPDRDECKLKLLEIHYATENREAFENFAKDLYADKKDGDPEFWGKVTEMGRELCPDSALFDSGESSVLNLADEEIGLDTNFGINRAIRNSEVEPASRTTSASEPQIPAFLQKSTSLVEDDQDADLADDFLRESLSADLGDELSDKLLHTASIDGDDSSYSSKDPMSLDFDFGLLPESTSESAAPDKGKSPSVPVDFGDLTDMNELETKLDLAKAFVDMEDVDSAREILEEIAKDGTDAQKAEARNLLAKIE